MFHYKNKAFAIPNPPRSLLFSHSVGPPFSSISAALFAILSRLEPCEQLSKTEKSISLEYVFILHQLKVILTSLTKDQVALSVNLYVELR